MTNRGNLPVSSNYNSINNSPFEKMKKPNQNVNKINVIYDGNPVKQIKTIQENHTNNSPYQFDVNLYFGNPKSSFTPIHPVDNNYYYPHHNNDTHNMNIPICLYFKNSLEKSGYKLTPEQTVQYKDIYKKSNSINSFYDDFNCYYFPMREFPINNNNNIINNIYPTFTKVTNVQILSDKDKNNTKTKNNVKNNYKNIDNLKNINNDLENKKENINDENISKKDSITESKEDKKNSNDISVIIGDNDINGNKKQKILFECSESNGPSSPLTSKKILKKKRLRKNNEQLELLMKFYLENKNWSKKQIKEISESIGLKENKIYKWLWDKKNKEYKVTKFVVNKNKDNME
jgi:hypothetical protein